MKSSFVRSAVLALVLGGAGGASGQVYVTWDGGAGNNNWNAPSNWVGDASPANPTTNYISLAGTTRLTPVVNTNWTILGLFISNNAGGFSLSGSNLTITASSPDQSAPQVFEHRGPSNVVVNNNIIIPASGNVRRQFLLNSAASATFNGMITNTGAGNAGLWFRASTAGGAGAASSVGTLNGRVFLGTNKFSKLDGVTWVIGTNGNQWGDTDIYHTGVLRIAAANAIPTNSVVTFLQAFSGGRLDLNNFSQTVAGLSSLPTNVVPTVSLGAGAGGTLTINSSLTNVFNGRITENGSLAKFGTGRQILMTNSTFTGSVLVAEGVLQLGTNRGVNYFNAAGATPAAVGGRVLTIRSGATLDGRGRDVLPGTMQVVINGTFTNEAYTMVGPVVMGGGRIEGGNGLNTTHKNLAFRYSVTVTGTTPSVITGMSGVTNEFHLENSAMVFDIRDVTGDANADLLVSGVLGNPSPNVTSLFGSAGGFIKTGPGTLLLDQVNTFSGTGLIQQGTVMLSTTGSADLAKITVGTGGVFDVTTYPTYNIPATQVLQGGGLVRGVNFLAPAGGSVFAGTDGTVGTLTFGGGTFLGVAGFTNVFDLTNSLAAGANDRIVVTDATFEPNNSDLRIRPLAPLVSGDYLLITYTGMSSTAFSSLLGDTTRDTWTLTDTTTGQVFLTVASGTNQSLIWTAQNSADWDLGTTTNWTTTPGAVADAYYDLDTVIFDDSGANSNVVNLTAAVKPTAIYVNSTSNYVIGGAGRIDNYATVPGLLAKDGTGSFALAVPAEFEGPTFVSNGTLQVGNGGGIGSMGRSVVTVSPGATLAYLRNDGGASPYLMSNVIAGAGTLNFLGVGVNNQSVYQPTNNNAGFTGQINIVASKLQPQNTAALGNGPINVIAGGTNNGSGQLFLLNAGTYTNALTAAGVGFMDSVTNHGALRLRSGATFAGTLTMTNNTRVGAFDGETGNLAASVNGPYELELFGRNGASLITVGSPVAPNYAATLVSGGTGLAVVVASNANAFSTGPMTINGGTLRMNGLNFSFSNLSSTASGGSIENRSTTAPATLTAGSDDTSTTYLGSFQNGSTQAMNLTKVGAGALTIFNNLATGTATAAGGTLVISNGSWSGPLVVSSGATVVALGGQGLLGQYYPVAPVVSGSNHVNIGFLPTFNRYLATLNPNLLYQSTAGTLSNSFHFGTAGANFPPIYSAGAQNFQGRWVGKFNATNAGAHSFSTGSDDGSALFINGALVVSNGFNQGINVPERTGTVTLAVGLHDIVIAFGQATGGYGLFANVIPPGGTKQPLANALLSSGPGVGSLTGPAGSMLVVSNGLLTIAQNMNTTFGGDISGNGGLQKIGTGTLTLNGASTYTDATVVASGELVVNGGIGSIAPFTVQPGARLSGSGAIGGPVAVQDSAALHAGAFGTSATLTFSNDLVFGALVTNVFDFSATTNDLLAVGGLFAPSNGTVFINPSAALANGQYPLVTYGTLSGTYSPTIFNLNPIASGTKRLSLDYVTPNEVRLDVGAGKTLTWNSPTSGIWDVQISSHWKDGLAITNEVFFQGDAVLFDDTPGVTQIVTIASNTAIWPGAITVNTSTNAFTLNIGGSLNGNFALVKNGTNTLTLNDTTPGAGLNQNLGSGGVTVNNGTLRLVGQNDGAKVTGPGLITVNAGGILQTDMANTFGQQQSGNVAPVLLNGGRFRPTSNNHMNVFTLMSNAVVERYFSAASAGLDFYALTGTPARIDVLASSATITNDGRMSILNSVTNTIFNIVDSAAAIDAEFSAGIAGSTTKFFVMTNTGTLLLSGPNDNNTLAGIIERGTLLLGKTGATIRAIGAGIANALDIRGTDAVVRLVGPGPDQIVAGSSISISNGTFDLNGWSESYNTLNGNGGTVLNNAVGTTVTNIFGENNGSGVYGGIIQNGAGTLAVAKAGTGSQTLTNANTYSGGTIVRAGTLVLSNSLGNALVGDVQIGIGSANSVLLSGFSEQIPDTSTLTFSSGGANTSGKLHLMGNTETVGGLSILAGTISLIQNHESEAVNTDGRFVLNNPLGNVSLFENNIIRDRNAGGTGKLSVVKSGAGTLVLSGTLTHSGPTLVSNGVLAINSTLTASPVTLDGGMLIGTGTFNMPLAANSGSTMQPGYLATATPLTLTNTATLAAGSALSLIANGTGAILRVGANNGLTLPAVGTVGVGVGPVSGTGTYVVVDYAGAIQGGTVDANLALTPQPRTVASLTNNTANTTIDLIVTALGEAIKWTGAADGIWNINNTTNWQTQTGLQPTAYLQPVFIGDSVLFDDSASGNYTISIPAGVNPVALAVSNSANDYTLTGEAIGGATGLSKDGTAKLSILTTNTFGGATVIKAGTLAIATDTSLGTVPGTLAPSQLVVGAGAEIEFLSSTTVPANRGIVLGSTNGGGVSTFDTVGNTVTIPGVLINNGAATGGLGKAGSGLLALNASNRFTGPVSIQNGSIRIGALGALGPVLSNTVTIANGGQLNLNGINQAGNNYAYIIAGSGPDGNGAIINTNGSIGNNGTVRWLNLAADATVGAMVTLGTANETGRFDLGLGGHIEGNGYNLTKTGHAPMGMRGTSSNLQLIINQGMVYVENATNGLGTNVIVNTTGYVAAYGLVPGRHLSVPVTLNGGTLASRFGYTNGPAVVTWAGPVTLTADSFLATRSISYPAEDGLIVAGPITGTNALTILGTSSNVVLTGSNTYTGGTTIHGRLQLGTNGATGSIVGNIVDNNQLIIRRSGILELGGDISGTGTVIVASTNTGGHILLSGTNTFTGNVDIQAGAVVVNNSQSLGNGTKTVFLNNAASFPSLTLDGTAGNITFATGITFQTSWDAAGNITNKAGDNTILGPFRLTSGGGNSSIKSVGGTLTLAGNITFIESNRVLRLGGTSTGTNTVSGVIQTSGGFRGVGLTKDDTGTWTITGNNTYPGTTTINAGLLQIGGGGSFGTLSTNSVVNNGSLLFNRSDVFTNAGIISGLGTLVQNGMGTLVLHRAEQYTGPTFISNGTLLVQGSLATGAVTVAPGATLGGTGAINGTVTSSGTVAPGASAGLLTLNNGYIQNAGAALAIELGGTTGGVDHDQLLVPGAALLDGALNVTFIPGYTGTVGSTYNILIAGGISGTFATTNLPALVATNTWNVEYTANQVVLSITNVPVAPTGYDAFSNNFVLALGPDGDDDNDGHANLYEYVTGSNPTNGSSANALTAARTNGNFALKFLRDTNTVDATLIVEGSYASTNDTEWIGFATNLNGSWGSSTNIIEGPGSPANVTAFDIAPAATNRFLRLRITRP